jgi:hypothetical protein
MRSREMKNVPTGPTLPPCDEGLGGGNRFKGLIGLEGLL